MMQAQREDATAAAEAARQAIAQAGALPTDTWQGVVQRARSSGVVVDQLDQGAGLVLDVPYPA